ncbi:MAG: Methionyl-tRNA formyltransferase [Patescibacteria group bacterium]|nr:Methionyl-tRNA formyltransferase [Patescibacteria group bacterium]
MDIPPKPFAFFGTPYVARDTLAYLASQGYVPEVVVSSPDAHRGRGLTLTPSETKTWALEHELKVLTPLKIDTDFIEEIRDYGCAYAIVVAYGKILPQGLIDAFPLGILNIHYSLLPKYRGASPVEGALLAGETETGVAIQQMVYALDAGDVLRSETTEIAPHETTRELRPRLVSLGARLLVDMLPAFEAGTLTPIPQDHTKATVTKKIRKEQGELSLKGDASANWNKYRAYAESPGTYTFLEKDGNRIRVKIRTATFEQGAFVPQLVVPEGKNETAYSSLVSSGYVPV